MNPSAPFTRSEAEIIRLITNLSVEDRPLVAIGSVLADHWKDKLERFTASYDLFSALAAKLGKRDSIRLFTLLALAAQSEKVGRGLSEKYLESCQKRLLEAIDWKFDWFSKEECAGEEVQSALGYSSRKGFFNLRKKHGVNGSSSGPGRTNVYSMRDRWILLRGRLAEMPWYEGRMIAAAIAGRAKNQTERLRLFHLLAPAKPEHPFVTHRRRKQRDPV